MQTAPTTPCAKCSTPVATAALLFTNQGDAVCSNCFGKQGPNIDLDEGHRMLLAESKRKLHIIGTLSLLFGAALGYLAFLGPDISLRLAIIAAVFVVSGILMFARAATAG